MASAASVVGSMRSRLRLSCCWAQAAGLAAGHAHVPLDRGRGRFDAEIVPLGLAGEQPNERLVHRLRTAAAQRRAKLDLLVVAQAAEDRPGRRHADAVAALAEIVRQRRDEAEADAQPV